MGELLLTSVAAGIVYIEWSRSRVKDAARAVLEEQQSQLILKLLSDMSVAQADLDAAHHKIRLLEKRIHGSVQHGNTVDLQPYGRDSNFAEFALSDEQARPVWWRRVWPFRRPDMPRDLLADAEEVVRSASEVLSLSSPAEAPSEAASGPAANGSPGGPDGSWTVAPPGEYTPAPPLPGLANNASSAPSAPSLPSSSPPAPPPPGA
ncbi:hypothetical protein, variant [Fonticula alba]|nr:hypothetical protein, variant [Fonticula alba]KCV70038.1 hypothetical protein, variant [Fonticula alba]|eukprot:XP_009495644.1 hypothetical protein, variant [Fonticula alba]